MKVKDLAGREHNLDTRQTLYGLKTEFACKSKIQYACGQLIKARFPLDIILEEVPLPGMRLYLDFLLPSKRIAFEIDGGQHGEYNAFFHKSQANFQEAIQRDSRKEQWCQLNEIELYRTSSIEDMKRILGL